MALPIQSSDAWIRARNQYIADLSDEEQRMYFTASPETLLDDASTAESSHGVNSTTRKVMEKLQPLVAAILQYGEAVDIYSSTYSLALGPIWGSIKILLHIAREFGKYFDKLVDMFARIGDVLPRFKTYERLFSNHERLIQALSMAYLDIITFCSQAKTVFRRGQRSSKTTLKVTFKLLWKPFDQQFGQQLSDFRQHQKNVEKEAGLAHMIESADARAVVLANQRQLEKQRRDDTRLRILTMLRAIDYEAKYRKLQNLRHPGTGDWLFQHGQYIEWETSSSYNLLSCRGIPGCGKSILASNLVDHLLRPVITATAPARDVVYYFCDYADQRTLQFDRFFGSLLVQLLSNSEVPESIEMEILKTYAGGTKSPAESALSAIFYSIAMMHPRLYIVLDGLDECERPTWQAILKVFKQLGDIPKSNFKLFITCVEEGPLSHQLTDFECLQFSPVVTAEDMKVYVTSSVTSKIDQGELRVRKHELKQEIVSALISRANGMFLWVFFQLQDLCNSSSDAEIRETLKNLPDGLGNTYRRILFKTSEIYSRAKLAQKVLKWVTVAKRPLHVQELKEAIAIQPEDKTWDDDKFPHEDLMFESCRGLIVKDEDETVHFAHHTVRQYITGGLTTKVDPFFEVSVIEADLLAGQVCVTYLLLSDFETQMTAQIPMATLEAKGVFALGGPSWIPSTLGMRRSMFNLPYKMLQGDPAVRLSNPDYWKSLLPQSKQRDSLSNNLKDKYRLLCYAIKYWEPHTRRLDSGIYLAHRLRLLAKYKILAFEFRPWGAHTHFGLHGCVGCPNPDASTLAAKDLPYMSMIHYVAAVGNLALLKQIDTAEISLRDYIYHERYHQETLLVACRNNQVATIEYLIGQAAYDIHDGKAVNAAAAAGNIDVVQFLLDISQFSVKQNGETPLISAASNGHGDIVVALLEAGADFKNYDEQTRRTIIESAATHGHDHVIRILNGMGAEILMDEPRAIRLAAANGYAATVRELLNSNCLEITTDLRFNVRDALCAAAESGYSSVVDVVREHGVLDVYNNFFNNHLESRLAYVIPIHLAAKNGHINVLESFKKVDEAVHSLQDREGRTPIFSAIYGSQNKVIRWLVENGANVNTLDGNDESPLHYAIKHGNDPAVRVLLELGTSSVEFLDSDHFEELVLYHADKSFELPIISTLLEDIRKDQKVNNMTKRDVIERALDAARKADRKDVADLLKQEHILYSQ